LKSIQYGFQGWIVQNHMALGGGTGAGGGDHRGTTGMAITVFVSQDPSVDQAGQVGSGVKPVDRVPPVAKKVERLLTIGSSHHLKAARSQVLPKTLPEGHIGVHDEDALVVSLA